MHGPKNWGLLCRFFGSGSWIPIYVTWTEAYLRTKKHLDPSSHLATTDMGRKLGAVLLWRELGPHVT